MSIPVIARRGLVWPESRLPRRALPPESEAHFQAKLIKFARFLGFRVFHPWTSIHSPSGWPDLVLVKGRRILFCELKSERGTLTDEQTEWLDALRQVPCAEVHIWRPSEFQDAARVLQEDHDSC